jgi:glycosyltransferase involved in cell wall biosynthesis
MGWRGASSNATALPKRRRTIVLDRAAQQAARLKIAFFIRALNGGGAQRDTILLANEIAARGHLVELLTLAPEGALRPLVSERVAIIPLAGGKLRSAVPALRRALIVRQPDVLISAEAAPNLVALLAARLLPKELRPRIVLREVGSPSIAQHLDPYLQNRVAYRALRFVYRFADVVVTLTEGARRDLAQNFGVPEQKVARMASNAVIDRDPCDVPDVQRERGLIVSVGRLSPEKDHATLIRAFAKLRRLGWRLEIAGEGPLRARLQALVGELRVERSVTLTGFVSDPFSVFRRAELAVSSSLYEGFGNAIVEALACGTPVVATDCPYGPREILAEGRYGRLVPVGDADALAQAIMQVMATVPDRGTLRDRAAMHTVGRAADALLGIIDGPGHAAPRSAAHTRDGVAGMSM